MSTTINHLQGMQQLIQQMQRHVEDLLAQQEAQQAEVDRLRKSLKQAEVERDELRTERDAFRHAVLAWAEEQLTQEELDRFEREEKNVDFVEFFRELEREHMQSKSP